MDPFELDPSLATPDEGPVGPPELSVAPVAPVPDVGLLPPTEPLLGAPPRLTVPPPPPPPPSPMQDPKQQLLAIIALGLATGQGVRGGGAGALHGFNETQKALRQDQLSNYQRQVNEQRVQDANARTQFAQDEQNYRQTNTELQRNLATFKTLAAKVSTKAEYDALAEAWGAGLRSQFGIRTMSPDWLRANIPYIKPSQQSLAVKAFEAWQKNPSNKKLLEQNPDLAATSVVEVDLNGDGVKERMPLKTLADFAGQSFAQTTQGLLPVQGTTKTAQSDRQFLYEKAITRFAAENRRPPTAKEDEAIAKQAAADAKDRPSDPLADELKRARIEELNRKQNSPNLSTAQQQEANRLATAFRTDSKDFIQRAQSYRTVLASAKDPSAAGDLSLIFAYMKMLDPGSVVREGEFATAQNATGVPGQILNKYNQVIKGERLNPTQRADFLTQARKIFGAAKQQQDAIVAAYKGRAATATVPENLVIIDYGAGIESADPLQAAKDKLRNRAPRP